MYDSGTFGAWQRLPSLCAYGDDDVGAQEGLGTRLKHIYRLNALF